MRRRSRPAKGIGLPRPAPAADGAHDLRARATRSIGWVVLERWGSRILTLVVFATLSRLVAPAEFGLISLATVFVALLQVFVDSGFSKALVQREHLDDADAPTAFWTALGIATALYALVFFMVPFAADAFDQPQLVPVLRVLALVLPISALSLTPAALLERGFGFKTLSLRQLVGATTGAAVAVGMALAGAGVWALVAQTLTTSSIAVITLWAATEWRPSLRFSRRSFRSLASLGLGILGIDLLDAVQGNIDKLLIGAFFSAEVLGYYFLAQRVGTILVELLTSVIARVTLTTFSRVQHDRARLNRVLRQLTFAASAIGVPVFGLVAVLAPQLIPVAFGSGWEQSIPILWILAPTWAFTSVMYFDRSVFLATGHSSAALVLAVVQNVVGLVLVFALLPLGIAGVALSRWARVLTWPLRLRYLHRLAGVRIGAYLGQLSRCIASIVPPAGLIVVLQGTAWANGPAAFWTFAVPAGLLAAALYAVLLWLLAGTENRAVLRQVSAVPRRRLRALVRRGPAVRPAD